MKVIKCEMCGSIDLVKKDSYFVCQDCGTKYLVEETKKPNTNETIDIKEKVIIDNQKKINNLYIIARRARDTNNYESALNYYELIYQEDPYSIEGMFYVLYYDIITCIDLELYDKIANLNSSIGLILDNVVKKDIKYLREITTRILNLCDLINDKMIDYIRQHKNTLDNNSSNFNIHTNFKNTYKEITRNLYSMLYLLGDTVEQNLFAFESQKEMISLTVNIWARGNYFIKINSNCNKYSKMTKENKKLLNNYFNKIDKYMNKYPDIDLIFEKKERNIMYFILGIIGLLFIIPLGISLFIGPFAILLSLCEIIIGILALLFYVKSTSIYSIDQNIRRLGFIFSFVDIFVGFVFLVLSIFIFA